MLIEEMAYRAATVRERVIDASIQPQDGPANHPLADARGSEPQALSTQFPESPCGGCVAVH
jgi:hypothetical protein